MEDLLNDIDMSPVLAKKSNRWMAAFIDYIVYSIVLFICSAVIGEPVPNEDGGITHTLTGWPAAIAIIISWLVLLPGIEGLNNGQTLGKKFMRVRAVNDDGSPLTLGKAIGRHLLDFIDYLPFLGIVGLIVASTNKDKKRVGDFVGKTIVVDALYTPAV